MTSALILDNVDIDATSISVAVFGLVVAWLYHLHVRRSKIPLFTTSKWWTLQSTEFARSGCSIISQGFLKYGKRAFQITDINGSMLTLITPEHWIFLSKLKDNVIAPAREELFFTSYTGSALADPALYALFGAQLPKLENNLDRMAAYFETVIGSSLPLISNDKDAITSTTDIIPTTCPPETWYILPDRYVIEQAYCSASWRISLGNLYNAEIVPISLAYTTSLSHAHSQLGGRSRAGGYLWALRTRDLQTVRAHLVRATKMLSPIFVRLRTQLKDSEAHAGSSVAAWLVHQYYHASDEHLTKLMLSFNHAFTLTTLPVTQQLVHELAVRPAFVDAIRREADTVLGQRVPDFTRGALRELTILDSFCKETHRLHPGSSTNITRRVCQPVQLEDGVTLPLGTLFEVTIQDAIMNGKSLEQPDQWDGYRYHNLRLQCGSQSRKARDYGWGRPTREDLNFGYGAHMCPGRSIGPEMIKIFLVILLRRCDLRLEGGKKERLPDSEWANNVIHLEASKG